VIAADADDVADEYRILKAELIKYNPDLLDKRQVIAISKSDLLDDELKTELSESIKEDFKGIPHLFISSVAQQNLNTLKDLLWNELNTED
jgi:GTP-binding protein